VLALLDPHWPITFGSFTQSRMRGWGRYSKWLCQDKISRTGAMGTIIHPFIEYDISVENESPFCPAPDGHVEIRAFNTGEFFTFSDYELFDALAFARSFDMGGRADANRPLSPPP